MYTYDTVKLGDLLEEYVEKNCSQKFKPVAIGKYGIRKREDIYSKELSKDISKNKVIFRDTLTIGMGSSQIDIGILTEDCKYCVSPAYTTYKINDCNSTFLKYYLEFINPKLSDQYMIISARQGKSVDKESMMMFELKMPSIESQSKVAKVFLNLDAIICRLEKLLEEATELITSQFVEVFGDISLNSKGFKIVKLSDIAEYWNGLTYKPQDVSKDGIIVLRSSNIQKGQLDFEDVVRVSGKINERKFVRKNDILMCSRNGSARLVGKTALIKDSNEKMSFGAFMMIIRSEYYDYLNVYFKTDSFRNQISTGATTTINQITSNMMNKIKLPLPEFELIGQFADFVKLIDKYKFEIEKLIEEYKKLKKGLMQRFFA